MFHVWRSKRYSFVSQKRPWWFSEPKISKINENGRNSKKWTYFIHLGDFGLRKSSRRSSGDNTVFFRSKVMKYRYQSYFGRCLVVVIKTVLADLRHIEKCSTFLYRKCIFECWAIMKKCWKFSHVPQVR